MRLRTALAGALAALAALVGAPAAAAENQVVQAVDGTEADHYDNRWSPKSVTIKAGETVTWRFEGSLALHNVAARGSNWAFRNGNPASASGPASCMAEPAVSWQISSKTRVMASFVSSATARITGRSCMTVIWPSFMCGWWDAMTQPASITRTMKVTSGSMILSTASRHTCPCGPMFATCHLKKPVRS